MRADPESVTYATIYITALNLRVAYFRRSAETKSCSHLNDDYGSSDKKTARFLDFDVNAFGSIGGKGWRSLLGAKLATNFSRRFTME
jgi:hypothetical protein